MILAGLILVVAGFLVWCCGDKFRWVGRLPGDIRIERDGLSVYFPVTTMILASLLLSALVWLFRKFGG